MNPILVSAAFGLVKGLLTRSACQQDAECARSTSTLHSATGRFAGALSEELQYRLMPHVISRGTLAPGATALPFGLAHVNPHAPAKHNAMRVLDAAVGGLLYESAFRAFGLWGAVAAHALHNFALDAAQGRISGDVR